MNDLDKVNKIKAFLGGIDKLTQGIDTEKMKIDGGLGTKDSLMVDVLRSVLTQLKDRNII